MSATKLILFEGIPGSGKSTTALHLQEYLTAKGCTVNFWREGNFDNPADFEGVACLSETGYQNLLSRYPQWTYLFQEQLVVQGADYLLRYRKLQHLHPYVLPSSLIDELSRYDVYDGLAVEDYCRLALNRWQDFQQTVQGSNEITILECCFLQNPLTVMLARHNTGPQMAGQQIAKIAEIVRSLNPLLIYLSPRDARAALEHVRAERPQEWAEFVTLYVTGQAYGKAHHLVGYEGVIQFYETRQRLELDILKNVPMKSLVIEHSGAEWERCDKDLAIFISAGLAA
jgi:hypothetical protein